MVIVRRVPDKEKPPLDDTHIGATAHTNNTGELTAIYVALSNALRRRKGRGKEIIWSDSLYAINMITGAWVPSKRSRNKEVVRRTRDLWRRLQRERGKEVTLRHVRSHIKVPGNEMADWLAEQGRMSGERSGKIETSSGVRWLREWLAREHAEHTTRRTPLKRLTPG